MPLRVAIVFLLPVSLLATGRLSGVAQDERGAALPAAVIRLLRADQTVAASGDSGVDGRFRIALPSGTYLVLILPKRIAWPSATR